MRLPVARALGRVHIRRMDWFTVKIAFLELSGLPRDMLHIYAGVLGQLAAAALFRRPIASVLPLIPLLAFELVNEWYDMQSFGGAAAVPEDFWGAAASDIIHTMALPVVLCLVARFAPTLMVGKDRVAIQAE